MIALESSVGIGDHGSEIRSARSPIPDPGSRIPDPSGITIHAAEADDAAAIHALVIAHLAEGHLLPRELGEIAAHSHRFITAVYADKVVACAELAPLSRSVAEIRSLVVSGEVRNLGVGSRIIDELVARASSTGFSKLSAFTHSPGYFLHHGFSIVPHAWLPEKIVTDCHRCPHFRRCGQYAVVRLIERDRQKCSPLAALHG